MDNIGIYLGMTTIFTPFCVGYFCLLHQINVQVSNCKHVFTSSVGNSGNPDQLPVDLDTHCFQIWIYLGVAW